MTTTSEVKFRRDTSFRKAVFSPDSFAHPAKMDAQLLLWIVDHYTKPGDTIADPMAGMGTTMLACTVGRNVILNELEDKFVKMQEASWNKVSMMPQLGHDMGDCQIIQGDARQLKSVLIDHAIFSPPYDEAQSGGGIAQEGYTRDYQGHKIRGGNLEPPGKRTYMPENVGSRADNISSLPYGSIDSVITSPPYAETGADSSHTRLPFWERLANDPTSARFRRDKQPSVGEGYSADPSNIGNLKGDTYLSAMLQVYQQCHKILKSGGLMVVVTKNFIRDKKEVRLDEDTIRLCEQAGFKFVERHYRKLPAQSFWRVIYQQKYPDALVLDKEDILVFQKIPQF